MQAAQAALTNAKDYTIYFAKETFNTAKELRLSFVTDIFKDFGAFIAQDSTDDADLRSLQLRAKVASGSFVVIISSLAVKTLGILTSSRLLEKTGQVGYSAGLAVGVTALAAILAKTLNATDDSKSSKSSNKGEEDLDGVNR